MRNDLRAAIPCRGCKHAELYLYIAPEPGASVELDHRAVVDVVGGEGMNEEIRNETIKAVREIYTKRLKLISRAIKATKLARDNGTFCTNFERAIAALELAEMQTKIDRDNQVKYWEEIE